MNTERTHMHTVDVSVESYSDSVYNLVIRKNNMKESRVEVSKKEADRICEILGVQTPYAEPKATERWD